MVFLTLFAANNTAKSTKAAPKLEAVAIAQLDMDNEAKNPPKILDPKINKATPKLAPEEIPNTNGPAKGFRNKVCISSPQMDSPEPTKIAVIAFGNRKLSTITFQLSFEPSPPNKI